MVCRTINGEQTTWGNTLMNTLIIFADGSCKGNPGPGGWCAVMKWQHHQKTIQGGESNTTNNRMELLAVIEGLKAVKKKVRIEVYTDSQYVRNGIEQWITNWKRNGWRTANKKPVKNKDLWIELDKLVKELEPIFNWIPGHYGIPLNELADRVANEEAFKQHERQRISSKAFDRTSTREI